MMLDDEKTGFPTSLQRPVSQCWYDHGVAGNVGCLSERVFLWEMLELVNFLSCHRKKVKAHLGEIPLPTNVQEFTKTAC